MKVRVDKDKCIGCGICPAVCEKVFTMDESGDKAEIIEGVEYHLHKEKIQEAIDACPVDAISCDK